MKHGKRPTVAQCKLMQAFHLNPQNWLVVKDTPETMTIVFRHSDKEIRELPKRKEW